MTRAEVEAEQDNVEVSRKELALIWPGRRPSGAFAGIRAQLASRSPHVRNHDTNQPDDQASMGQRETLVHMSCKVI